MISRNVIWIIVAICPVIQCQRTFLDNPTNIQLFRVLKDIAFQSLGGGGSRNDPIQKIAKARSHIQYEIPPDIPFPCDITRARSKSVPTSVNQLRPGDIDVVGAMGDSLTAGFGIYATRLNQVFIEHRGSAGLGGGQGTWRDTLTVPNILKEFNPNLIGYPKGDAWSHHLSSELNVAESISMSRDLPYMAQNLINRMKKHPDVDMKNHWKMITIFIGANDFCTDMCYFPSAWTSLQNHKKEIIKTLRLLRDNLPRTLVSIIPAPFLKGLIEMKGRSFVCQMTTSFECSCLFGLAWRKHRDEFYRIMRSWIDFDESLPTYGEFQTNDFSVVTQTFINNVEFPPGPDGNGDFRYLSADCFHLSQMGQARGAFSAWKNLLEPVGNKTRFWEDMKSDLSNFPCPTPERPYIATIGNS